MTANLTDSQKQTIRIALAKVIKHRNGTVLIDEEDYERAISEGWSLYPFRTETNAYVQICRWNRTTKKQEKMRLHQFILGGRGQIICHLNGDGLDCRRSNLSFGTAKQNACSYRKKRKGASSKYRGVYINNGGGKRWSSQLWDGKDFIHLGRFNDEEEAARAYDKEASKRFGKFAHINFPTFALNLGELGD